MAFVQSGKGSEAAGEVGYVERCKMSVGEE
jgi:hypothetical protein